MIMSRDGTTEQVSYWFWPGRGGGGLFGRNPQRHQQQLHKISTAGHVLLALAVRVLEDPGEEPGLRLKSWRKQTLVREDVRHAG